MKSFEKKQVPKNVIIRAVVVIYCLNPVPVCANVNYSKPNLGKSPLDLSRKYMWFVIKGSGHYW